MRERPEPRCAGRSWLFLSTNINDHVEAKADCLGPYGDNPCPLLVTCQRTADDILATPKSREGLHGTWAGKLYNYGKVKTNHAKPREHGTEKGYYQHSNRHEAACRPCLNAMAAATRARRGQVA